MKKLCTDCKYIGKEIRTHYYYIIGPLFLLAMSYICLHLVSVVENRVFIYLALLSWFIFGIYTLSIFIQNPDSCPNCKKSKTMIPLDTPRAQELIKENNLSLPTESSEQTKAPTT